MATLNPAVLGAVAKALSNDRYPKDGVGFVVSDADRRSIEKTIVEEMVRGAEDQAITASIKVFANAYSGAPDAAQSDWAKQNKARLDGLVAKLPVLRAQIGGGPNGDLEKAKSLAASLSRYTIGLDVREDGPDTTATHRSLPELEGASRSRLMRTFSEDRRTPGRAGEFKYSKGEQAIADYLAHVELEPEGRRTLESFRAILADPAIEQIHFIGSWAGEDWGVGGYADWNLVLELGSGNFVHLQTNGGWQ